MLEICDSGDANDMDTGRLGQGNDESLGHRTLLTFLRGPPEQRLLGVLSPRDKVMR